MYARHNARAYINTCTCTRRYTQSQNIFKDDELPGSPNSHPVPYLGPEETWSNSIGLFARVSSPSCSKVAGSLLKGKPNMQWYAGMGIFEKSSTSQRPWQSSSQSSEKNDGYNKPPLNMGKGGKTLSHERDTKWVCQLYTIKWCFIGRDRIT